MVSRLETRERAACSSNHPLTFTRENSATFSPKYGSRNARLFESEKYFTQDRYTHASS